MPSWARAGLRAEWGQGLVGSRAQHGPARPEGPTPRPDFQPSSEAGQQPQPPACTGARPDVGVSLGSASTRLFSRGGVSWPHGQRAASLAPCSMPGLSSVTPGRRGPAGGHRPSSRKLYVDGGGRHVRGHPRTRMWQHWPMGRAWLASLWWLCLSLTFKKHPPCPSVCPCHRPKSHVGLWWPARL